MKISEVVIDEKKRKKKRKKKNHYYGSGYYGGWFGNGTSSDSGDAGGMGESVIVKFATIEISESQINNYINLLYKAYGKDSISIPQQSNVKNFANKKLLESSEYKQITPFIQLIREVDSKKEISAGDMFSVLAFEIIFSWREVNVFGFTNPKKVKDVKLNPDNTINYITFTDGDRYPRVPIATYKNKPIIETAYFTEKQEAESALSVLTLAVPDEWDIDTSRLNNTDAIKECSGYIPKNEKEAKDPRWSMAITDDVKPGEEQRNLKKLGLK
jgi:hypothetical protein